MNRTYSSFVRSPSFHRHTRVYCHWEGMSVTWGGSHFAHWTLLHVCVCLCERAILIEWIKYKITRRRERERKEKRGQYNDVLYMLFPFLFRAFEYPILWANEENRKWKIKRRQKKWGKGKKMNFTALHIHSLAHRPIHAGRQTLRSSN